MSGIGEYDRTVKEMYVTRGFGCVIPDFDACDVWLVVAVVVFNKAHAVFLVTADGADRL